MKSGFVPLPFFPQTTVIHKKSLAVHASAYYILVNRKLMIIIIHVELRLKSGSVSFPFVSQTTVSLLKAGGGYNCNRGKWG